MQMWPEDGGPVTVQGLFFLAGKLYDAGYVLQSIRYFVWRLHSAGRYKL